MVQVLLENGCEALRKDDSGQTTLSAALGRDRTDIVRMLLEYIRRHHDGDLDKVEDASIGHARLWLATNDGDVVLVEYLLERGADVDMKFDGSTRPLHKAVMKQSTMVMSLLLRRGSNIEVRDDRGETPLHLAAMGSYEEGMEFLLDHGADIQAASHDRDTPLHLAA